MQFQRSHCDATDEVRYENIKAAGQMMMAREVFDEEMGAGEDTTENGEAKVEVVCSLSKAQEVFDKEMAADDNT